MSDFHKRFFEFGKPFILGAKSVFETMVFTSIQTGKPILKDSNQSRGEISSVMGIMGTFKRDGAEEPFKGMFVLSFPKQTYLKIAGAMLMEDFTEVNEENEDVGAEISNIITGNAKRSLADLGYAINMSIPSTISGVDHTIKYPAATHVILIPVNCDHGEFFMEICYHD